MSIFIKYTCNIHNRHKMLMNHMCLYGCLFKQIPVIYPLLFTIEKINSCISVFYIIINYIVCKTRIPERTAD